MKKLWKLSRHFCGRQRQFVTLIPRIFLVFLGGSSVVQVVQATGFGFEYQSVEASARGNTYVAGFSDPSMLHYNPAALSGLDSISVSVNSFLIRGQSRITQSGTEFETDEELLVSGSIFVAMPMSIYGKKITLGAGVRSPYGQSSEWVQPTPFSAFGTEAEMIHLEYVLGAGVEVGRGVSIGANVFVSDSEITTYSSGVFVPGDQQRFSGDDVSVGYQLALHHQVSENFSWGINYRSGIRHEYEGSLNYQSIGYEWQIHPRFSMGMQAQWSGWSSVDAFRLETPLGSNVQPVRWKDNWNLSCGVSYALDESCTLHGGYMFTESIIDEPYHTPLNGDFDQHFLSLGFSKKFANTEVNVAVVRLLESSQEIDQSLYGFSGQNESDGWFLNLGLTQTF